VEGRRASRRLAVGALTFVVPLVFLALAGPVAGGATIPTNLTLEASPTAVYVGDTVTLTATVTPNPGACPVTIHGQTFVLDAATGTATTEVTALSEAHQKVYTAGFMPCGDYMGYPGFVETSVDISRRATTSSLTSAATVGRGDAFSVSVALTGVPDAGTVAIREVGPNGIDGILNRIIGSAVVSGSPVTVDLPSMLPGTYALRAEYQGSTEWAPSQSTTKALTVFDRPTTTSITVGPDPSLWGQEITVDIQVSPIPDDGGGVEVLLDGFHAAWPVMDWTTGTGSASFTPNLPGSHTVTAAFRGSAYPIPRYGESQDSESQTVSEMPIEDDPPVGSVSVNGGADVVTESGVTLTFSVSDASTIQKLELSNDGTTWEQFGNLDALYWSLGAAGGSGAEGARTVYARWTDAWNNVSAVATDSFTFDWTGPSGVVVIDGSGNYTIDGIIVLSVAATDAGSGVSKVAASNDGTTWTEQSYAPSIQWSVGSGDGVKTVHVKWRDGNGHWSDESTDTIVRDSTAPVTTVASSAFVGGATVSSGLVPTKLTWSGSDSTSGIYRYHAEISIDGGPWSTMSTSLTSPALTRNLAPGHSYRVRTRAADKAGNVGGWATGSSFSVTAYQESSGSIVRTGTWALATSSSCWGGAQRVAKLAGASAKLTFTGRSLAWIGSVGPTRGSAKIYVNGVLTKTVSLYSASAANRRVIATLHFASSANRTIKVVVVGTSGHPSVALDAFVTAT